MTEDHARAEPPREKPAHHEAAARATAGSESAAASPVSGARTKRWLTLGCFLAVVLAALAVRLLYLAELSENPLFEHPILDAKVHHEWAQDVAAGKPWSVDPRSGDPIPYFRAPLYIWFLGGIYRVFGIDPGFAPRLIQSLLGALSCGLLFLLGARLFSRKVGLAAGLTAAVYWILVYFDNELLIVPLIVFLDLAALLLLVMAAERRRWLLYALAGACLGLSAIARPNILLFAPFACLWIVAWEWRRPQGGWRCGLGRAVLFGVCLLLPIVPITIRNYTIGHDRVLIASQGGMNFFIGNNPHSDGVSAVIPGASSDWWEMYDAANAMAARELGGRPQPSEVSRFFFQKAIAFMRDDPGAAAWLMLRKAHYFVARQEIYNNKCIYTFTEEFTPITRWLVIGFGSVGPLALLGLGLCLRRGQRLRLFPLYGFVLVYACSVILFFVTARFRVPVVPVLILFAVYACFWLVESARRQAYRPLAIALAALALLSALVLQTPGPGFSRIRRNPLEFYCTMGNELARQGQREDALLYLDKVVESARTELAGAATAKREFLRRMLASTLLVKGSLLVQEERSTEALAAWQRAFDYLVPLSPEAATIHDCIGALLDRQGRDQEALRHKQQAARIRRSLGGRSGLRSDR